MVVAIAIGRCFGAHEREGAEFSYIDPDVVISRASSVIAAVRLIFDLLPTVSGRVVLPDIYGTFIDPERLNHGLTVIQSDVHPSVFG